jgi:hypothetical protein
MKVLRLLGFVLLAFSDLYMFGQHPNVLISDTNSPDEPSIAIDANNTNRLVAGANLNNIYYSDDAGQTWTIGTLTSPEFGVWGDPTIACDKNGDFYFFHLSNPNDGIWIDRIVCQKSVDGGQSWNDGTYTGLNLPKQQDKQWPVVDRSNNNIYLTWTEFDEYGSNSSQDSSRILFSKSLDGGMNWTTPIRLNKLSGDCIDSDNTAEGATPCVGPNGEIFVAWANQGNLYFDRSLDQGESWMENDLVISDQPGGWDYSISGIMRCNGLPVTACDTSGGAFHGNIYVNWTDHRNGENNTDVFVATSSDGGLNWSDPIKVNNDIEDREQFFTWMTIDQVTGYVWFVFYDRRNYEENSEMTDVYMAVSYDGCQTFTNFKISESPFDPNPQIFFGDYTNVTAHNEVVRPIWTRLQNSQKSIYTAIIDADIVGIDEPTTLSDFSIDLAWPNPAVQSTYFSFKIHHPCEISIDLFDVDGRKIKTIAYRETFGYGKYTVEINVRELGLEPGVYYLKVQGEKNNISHKILVIH